MNSGTLLSVVPALALAGACSAMIEIPGTLAPGNDASLAMVLPAKGVQIYECRAKAGSHEWAFVAPDALLFNQKGQQVGHHGAGPYWEAMDGSRVVASVKARADAPSAGAIPWLLLSAKSTGPSGAFSQVTSIQRVNTAGGTAPTQPCTRESVGQQARVDYAADYRFFTSTTR
jgi:hypothetical protein